MAEIRLLTEQEMRLAAGGQSSIPIIGPLIDWLRGAGGCSLPAGGSPAPNLGPNHSMFPNPPTPNPIFVPGEDIPNGKRPRLPGGLI
jgi:hypothetical protein